MSRPTETAANKALYQVSHLLLDLHQVQRALTAVGCLSRMEGIHQSEFADQLKRDDLAALLQVISQQMEQKVEAALKIADQ